MMQKYSEAQKMTQARTRALMGVAILVLSWLEVALVRYSVPLGVLLVVASVLTIVVLLRGGRAGGDVRSTVLAAGVGIAAYAAWWLTSWYPATVVAQIALLVVAFACMVMALRGGQARHAGSRPRRAIRAVAASGVAVAALASVALVSFTISPVPAVVAMQQSLGYGNSFEPSAPTQQTVLDDGTLRTSDVSYESEYPNGFLDIYIAGGDATVKRPTYVYVHGGGWMLGSKEQGDPAAGNTDGIGTIADPMLAAGYNVVFVNYALVPEVEYPTPTRQLSEAIAFLQVTGAEYGLDMDQVVLAGASAGASIAGQLAAIETNPAYADEVGIAPVMHGNLSAVVLDSAPLDPSRAGQTQSPSLSGDVLFNLAGRAYLGTTAANWEELNLIDNVDGNYPAAFISDGNTGTFPDQSEDMSEQLDSLGVENELALFPVSEAVLGHGYMASPSPSTDEYNLRKVDFLDAVLDR